MSAKALHLHPIPSREANKFVREHHYSGKVVSNSQVHIGVFWNGSLEGAMQFGDPLDRRKLLPLVRGTQWHQLLELNRLVFTEKLPRNSESRALAIAMRLMRAHAPQVKWLVSYADGTQCGDGTIYRATGFVLTAIKENDNLARLSNGTTIAKMTLECDPTRSRSEANGRSYYDITGGKYDFRRYVAYLGGEILRGFQLRYVYFLDPTWRDRLTVEPIPYSRIQELGAGMYRGTKTCAGSKDGVALADQAGEGATWP
jgi:hypothetical protein